MADRGTAVAFDAEQIEYDVFEHVPRSIGDFGDLFTAIFFGPW